MSKNIEDKIKDIEYKSCMEIRRKISEKEYRIDYKFRKKVEEFSKKVEELVIKEKLLAKNKIVKAGEMKMRNKIRRAKGHKEVKYKKKQKTLAYLKEKCLYELQKYARLRDSDENGMGECITCGDLIHWKKKGNGGHWITRGINSTAFDLRNINLQCIPCNNPSWKGFDPGVYRTNLIKKIGLKEVELLEIKRHRLEPLDRQKMIDLTEKYKTINQGLEAQKI